jgi:hypothetical protein
MNVRIEKSDCVEYFNGCLCSMCNSYRERISFNCDLSFATWMSKSMNTLRHKKLCEVCLPGSHNSGMYTLSHHTAFSTPNNSLCQFISIRQQLLCGIRYFDIRPTIVDGIYYCGHYTQVNMIGYQGACGQTIDSIVQEINQFINDYPNELILLNISHPMKPHCNPIKFSMDDWNILYTKLELLHNCFQRNNYENIFQITIEEFITSSNQPNMGMVLLLQEKGLFPSEIMTEAMIPSYIHSYSSDQLYDNYSDTNQLKQMTNDQMEKLIITKSINPTHYFILSWTLTLQSIENISPFHSIYQYALRANATLEPSLIPVLYSSITKIAPNVIFVDYADSRITEYVLKLNQYLHDPETSLVSER